MTCPLTSVGLTTVAVLIVTLHLVLYCGDRQREVTQLEQREVGQPDQWCRPLILNANDVQCRSAGLLLYHQEVTHLTSVEIS